MFDDLFKTDSINKQASTSKSTGMFDDVFKETVQPTVIEPTTPGITPVETKKEKFNISSYIPKSKILNKVGSLFLSTNPLTSGAYNLYKANKSIDQAMQPIIDKTLNTELGKQIVTTTEKATRGSSIFKAVPTAIVETLSDKLAGIKTDKDIVDYYGEAVDEWEKGGQDPTISFAEKISRGVLDSGVQSGVGVLLNFIPFIGKGASTAYYGALSASEQVNERGQVNSIGNIAIDVIGDRILGNTLEGLFKKPAKDLIKTGFVETAKNAGKGFLVEGTTEPAQTFLKYVNDYRMAKSPEERQSIVDNTKEYVKNGGMLLEFLVGGISGAGISTIASLASQSQINPNIPKPKLGITEDDDKEFNPEQNKIREAFREDVKQNLTDTVMNKPYVSRQISKETGLNNDITTLLVDEVAESMKVETPQIDIDSAVKQAEMAADAIEQQYINQEVTPKMKSTISEAVKEFGPDKAITTLIEDFEMNKTQAETLVQQALNEAGSTLEETKTPEVVTEQPKLKISKEEPITVFRGGEKVDISKITEDGISVSTEKKYAESYKNSKGGEVEEFTISPEAKILSFNKIPSQFKTVDSTNGWMPTQGFTSIVEYAKNKGFDVVDLSGFADKELRIINPKILSKAQGEAKMKIKKTTEEEKVQMSKLLENLDTLPLKVDGKLEFGDSDLYFRLDQMKTKDSSGEGLTEEEWLETKELLEEAGLGLDTLETKEDNKTYGTRKGYSEGDNGTIQYNEGGTKRSDIAGEFVYSLEAKQGGEFTLSRRQTKGKFIPESRTLPQAKEPGEIKKIIIDFLPEAKPETINEIVKFYNLSNKFGKKLTIQRTNTLNGREDFVAGMDPYDTEFILSLKHSDMENIKPSDVRHEIGHAYWHSIGSESRKQQLSYIKQDYNNRKELYDTFQYKNDYWVEFIKNLKYWVGDANKQLLSTQVTNILKEIGLIDQNNKVILPEDVIESSFNFEETNKKLNTYLTENKLNTSYMTEEYNNLMADEINSFFFENVEMLEDSTIPEVKQYAEDIKEYNIEFKKGEVSIKPVSLKIKKESNLTPEQQIIVRTPEFKNWFGDWENDPANSSKIVDENGEPMVVYHGSPSIFDTFDISKKGATGQARGYGFYFTPNKMYAAGYMDNKNNQGKLFEVFLNLRHPYSNTEKTFTKSQIKKVFTELSKIDKDHLSNWGDYTSVPMSVVINEATEMTYDGNDNDVDIVAEISNVVGDTQLVFDLVKKITGGDGVIDVESPEYKGEDFIRVYVVQDSNQIKSATGNITFGPTGDIRFSLNKSTIEELKTNLSNTQKALDKAVANPEVYGQNSIITLNQKVADLRRAIMEEKYPNIDTGDKITDARAVLANIESKLGVSSIVNSIKEKETAVEIAKEVLDMSPMKDLEPYVADAGDFKGTLPEVTGKSIEEIKQNKAFRGVKNEKAIKYASSGDEIAQEIVSEYGMDIDSNEVKEEFEDYQKQKENITKEEKQLKQDKLRFGNVDTFELLGKDKSLTSEIIGTRDIPKPIKDIMNLVKEEKKSMQEEVINHPARPLMKYVGKNNKLPTDPKTAFGKESEQILKELKFTDVKEANKAIADYIEKRDDFVNPIGRLRMKERAAKFLRDKEKIMEEVEKKVRAEGRDRKSKIEAIRDFFYMTDTEIKETLGDVDYRLVSDKQFEEIIKKLEEKSIEIAEHAVAVAEVEWTIAQKELHRVENLQELMDLPKNLKELTTEQLSNLNSILGNFKHGDVFLGLREMETLAKNADLPDIKTQRQILEEVIGKRTNVPMEEIRKITSTQMDKFRSAVSLARQNPFYEIMVNDAYALKVEAGIRYQEVENKINELTKTARESRRRTFIQRLVPTDDMVIAYLEEGDLTTKQAIAKDMTKAELELAHYVQGKYAEMRDYLMERQQLEKYREQYYTHRPRGFFEAWLRDEVIKSPKQFIRQFGKAFKEVVFDEHKMDQAAFNITNEKTKEILPLEKFFKYSMRRSGQLIPTRNLAKAFLGYTNTFEVKRGLDKYIPRMEAVARALTPQETTEGGLIRDTSLENFVAQWINTQKGRPLALKFINPGDTLDTIIRAGVAFTRTLDLALRIPAQFMSLVGEESATWINIGNKRYLLGQYRAKTGQGNKIAKKYESLVGRTFWDKMKEDSKTFESKLGETMFAFYAIAARNANIHHLLGSLTEQEFKSGNITTKRLGELKQEMTKWRADDVLSSVMGKTSIGQVFRQHKSWAIPIFTQTLSNLQDIKNMVASGEYKTAAKSKQFGELFRATMLTLILVLTLSKWYKDLKDDQDRTLVEELEYRAINDALSFMSALTPSTLFKSARLISWTDDMVTALSTLIGAMLTGEKTASGKTPGLKDFAKSFTPKIFQGVLKDDEEDKIMANISQSVSAAQEKIDVINKDIVEPAQTAWESVKIAGVDSDKAKEIVNELSDDQYEAYKLVKKADTDYWIDISKKVTPIVQEAYKVGFGTEEAKPLVSDLNKDEYEQYKKIKTALYSKEPTIAEKNEWKEQTFIQHVTNIAKGWSTDPVDAFNKLIKGDWQITELKNGQIIVNRLPMDVSQKIKEEAAKNNKDWKLDHINAIKSGGGNDKENLNIISTEEWQENTPVEVYVIKKLDAGKITGKQAKEYLIRFKVGRKQIISGKYFEEYKDKPITFEEIKKEIGE